MAFVNALDVDVGDPTKASDHDQLADNTEFNRETADAEHDFDISTGDGSHKDVTASSVVITSSATDAEALDVVQNGALADGEHGLRVYTNANQQESALVHLHSDNASSDHGITGQVGEGAVLAVTSDGSAAAVKAQATAAGGPGLGLFTADYTGMLGFHGGIDSDLSDDSVATVFQKAGTHMAFFEFVNTANGAVQASGVVTFRTTEASKSCAVTQFVSTVTVDASTAVLAGTTGSNGNLTISANNSVLQLENRSGATTQARFIIFG